MIVVYHCRRAVRLGERRGRDAASCDDRVRRAGGDADAADDDDNEGDGGVSSESSDFLFRREVTRGGAADLAGAASRRFVLLDVRSEV